MALELQLPSINSYVRITLPVYIVPYWNVLMKINK